MREVISTGKAPGNIGPFSQAIRANGFVFGVFLKDMNDFSRMNAVYARYFAADPPARTTVEVARLPKDVLVEIDAIALAGA